MALSKQTRASNPNAAEIARLEKAYPKGNKPIVGNGNQALQARMAQDNLKAASKRKTGK